MAFGSVSKKLKTNRISSSSIINENKKNRLVHHFSFVKKFKNTISKHIFDNRSYLLSVESKNILISHAKNFNCEALYSWEVQKIFQQSVDFYSNWMDKIISNNKFFIQKEFKIIRYKRKVVNNKGETIAFKGKFKSYSFINKSTSLTNLMNWLIFVEENNLDSVLKSLVSKDSQPLDSFKLSKALEFNNKLNELRNKPYWHRIKALIINKKNRMLNSMKEPIVYTTGSYMKIPKIGQTKHSHIFVDDTNTYQYWYNFRIGKEHIHVPLSFNKNYHENINRFNLESIHTVRLNKKKGIDIGLTYEDDKEYFKPIEKDTTILKEQVCGIDLNIASNFCTIAFNDEVKAVDYNRTYIEKVVNYLKTFESKGFKQLTTQEQLKFEKLLGGVEFYFKSLISSILKDLIKKGITDIVMENLDLSQCKASFIKDETLNIKYSKLIRLLRLSSIKEWFKEQANNKGIRVHLTTPSYTSKTCSNCQCVEHTVRKGRFFECSMCGHKDDADENASKNIRNRIIEEVLRFNFHEIKDGQYVPLKMKRETVLTKLTVLYEVDNERQRELLISKGKETSSFRAR